MDYRMHGLLTHAEFFSEHFERHDMRYVSRSDGQHLFLREFITPCNFSAAQSRNDFRRMTDVLLQGQPFKVFRAVVCLVQILVVDRLFGVLWHPKKRHGDEPVNHFRAALAVLRKNAGFVATKIALSNEFGFCTVASCSMKASNPTVARCFIKSFVSGDWFPDFVHFESYR